MKLLGILLYKIIKVLKLDVKFVLLTDFISQDPKALKDMAPLDDKSSVTKGEELNEVI